MAPEVDGERPADLVAIERLDDLVTHIEHVLAGYRAGLFPMWLAADTLGWFDPTWRALLRLEGSLSRVAHRSVLRHLDRWSIRVDAAPTSLHALAADPARPGAWIDERFVAFYQELLERGVAHSVECWEGERLLGGCFGLVLGRCFIGETMVSRERDASKVAFVGLVAWARESGLDLIDGQWVTPHLRFLGFEPWERRRAHEVLRNALGHPEPILKRGELALSRAQVRCLLAGEDHRGVGGSSMAPAR